MLPITLLISSSLALVSLAAASTQPSSIPSPLVKPHQYDDEGVAHSSTAGGQVEGSYSWQASSESAGVSSSAAVGLEGVQGGGYSSIDATVTSSAVEVPPTAAAAPAPANIDAVIFNFALTLERLETAFYTQALDKFDLSALVEAGYSELQAAAILEQVQVIAFDELSHVEVITGALKAAGATPFEGCGFSFDSALADRVTFVSVARTLEAAGVAAYLGAARLITDPALLTAAASIATLEARHQTLLNILNGGSAAPQPFDLALAPEQVLTLAGGFLVNCSASDLVLTADAPLSITSEKGDTSFSVGTKLIFASSVELDVEHLTCQMLIGGAAVAQIAPASACYIPEGVDGPVAIFLTNTTTPLQSNLINQDARGIQAGPGLIFVDSISTVLGLLFAVQSGHHSFNSVPRSTANSKGQRAVAQVAEDGALAERKIIAAFNPQAKDKSRMVKVKRNSAGPRGASKA